MNKSELLQTYTLLNLLPRIIQKRDTFSQNVLQIPLRRVTSDYVGIYGTQFFDGWRKGLQKNSHELTFFCPSFQENVYVLAKIYSNLFRTAYIMIIKKYVEKMFWEIFRIFQSHNFRNCGLSTRGIFLCESFEISFFTNTSISIPFRTYFNQSIF